MPWPCHSFGWYFETHWLPKHYCRQSKLCHGNVGNGNWIFQQDNATCHSAAGVQEWFEEHNFRMLPPTNWASAVCAGQTSPSPRGPALKLRDWKNARFLVPDATAHLKRSCGVHASIGQCCFGAKRGTFTISSSYNVMAGMLIVFCTSLLTPVIITYLGFFFLYYCMRVFLILALSACARLTRLVWTVMNCNELCHAAVGLLEKAIMCSGWASQDDLVGFYKNNCTCAWCQQRMWLSWNWGTHDLLSSLLEASHDCVGADFWRSVKTILKRTHLRKPMQEPSQQWKNLHLRIFFYPLFVNRKCNYTM